MALAERVPPVDRDTRHRVADLLDKLANGDTIALGEFTGQGDGDCHADAEAEALREIAVRLRGHGTGYHGRPLLS